MYRLWEENKLSITLAILLPLFSLLFLTTIFGNGQLENLPVGVVDKDNSAESREVIRMVQASPSFNLAQKYHYMDENLAREALQNMDIYGYFVIPSNYEKDLYNKKEPVLNFYFHYGMLAVGGEVNRAFATVLSTYKAHFIAERVVGSGLDESMAKAVVMPATLKAAAIGNPNLNYTTFISYPFFFVFFQIIILTLIVYTVGKSIQNGIEDNLHKVLKKVYLLMGIFLAETLFANFVFFVFLDIPCASSPTLVTISSVLFVLATISLAMIIAIGIPRMSIAISTASLVGALGATLSGVTFPLDQMYPLFQWFSYLFPVRYFTEIQHNLMYNYIGLEHSWIYFATLLAFVLAALLMLPRLEKILKKATTEERGSNYTKSVPIIYTLAMLMIGGTYGYGILYNMLYDPNIITEIPVAVVDKSNTQMSRKYISYIDATQAVNVSCSAIGFHEAKELMKSHKVRGIIYIPPDFEEKVTNGESGTIMFYETTTTFLYYLNMQAASNGAVQKLNDEYRQEIIKTLPPATLAALSSAPSVSIKGTALYNQNSGYGSFLLPIVMTLILFQIMLLTFGNFLGSRTETLLAGRKTLAGRCKETSDRYATDRTDANMADTSSPATSSAGTKRAEYSSVFSLFKDAVPFVLGFWVISFCLLGLYPIIFELPTLGNQWLLFSSAFLFLLATGFMACACSFFFRDRERVMLYVPFFSVGLIFISGMSFPANQIPWFWSDLFYYLFPSSPFIKLFIKLNTLGASFHSISHELTVLFMQCAVYFCIAIFVYRHRKLTLLKDLSN